MGKPVLFVIHGMGKHNSGWENEIKDTLNAAMTQFPVYKTLSTSKPHRRFTDFAKVVPLSYDDLFEKQRKAWAEDAKPVINKMTRFPASSSESNLSELEAASLINLQAGLEKESFFNTHVVDVLLYRFTDIGERVRVSVAKKIVETLEEGGGTTSFSILAHSLGTSVIHDALHALYSQKSWRDGKISKTFKPGNYKASHLIMLANVSRVLQSTKTGAKAYKSRVKPGPNGVCKRMFNVAHVFDPIAQTKPFVPGDQWLAGRQDVFEHLPLNSITAANVHALKHYLGNPLVYIPILRWFTADGSIPKGQATKAFNDFRKNTANSKHANLINRLEGLKLTEPESWQSVLKAWRDYAELIRQFTAEMEGAEE